jgi:ferredoxin
MATVITSECINCGACEPECPNTAIYQGGVEWELDGVTHPAIAGDIFYIVPEKCTECVGFFDHEACAAVCPVDCCIPDPNRPETEDVLLARARQLHPEQSFGTDFPSRFRKEGVTPSPEAAEPKAAESATKPSSAPTPAPAPQTSVPSSATDVGLAIPEVDEWEVPIACHHCQGTYAVAFGHFRSGVVFYCPFCNGSCVVTTSMHNHVHHRLREFRDRWSREFESFQAKRQQELAAFEERQRRELEQFNASLQDTSQEFKPPGAPRKRAWIFG